MKGSISAGWAAAAGIEAGLPKLRARSMASATRTQVADQTEDDQEREGRIMGNTSLTDWNGLESKHVERENEIIVAEKREDEKQTR
jgi:hypothetical protein